MSATYSQIASGGSVLGIALCSFSAGLRKISRHNERRQDRKINKEMIASEPRAIETTLPSDTDDNKLTKHAQGHGTR